MSDSENEFAGSEHEELEEEEENNNNNAMNSLTETNRLVGKRGCDFLIAFQHVNGPSNWWGLDCLKCLS